MYREGHRHSMRFRAHQTVNPALTGSSDDSSAKAGRDILPGFGFVESTGQEGQLSCRPVLICWIDNDPHSTP